jgi:polyisoprenoid-binding protein YceI
MKLLKLIFAFLLITTCSKAQTFTTSDEGSKVHFTIKNFGIKVGGDFKGLKGTIVFNPKSLTTSNFNVSVEAKTIDTDNGSRDGHLRKDEYFGVEKFPTLTFVSTKITESSTVGRFYMFGTLTIKGVAKAVEFGFSATPSGTGYIFNGEFEINRRDFGVGGKSNIMADKLKVTLQIAAKK